MRIDAASAAYHAYSNAVRANTALNKNLEKLASGTRITKASDDAAGLAISERIKSQITGQQVALRNAQDMVSLSQVREGALSELSDCLARSRELAIQASNDTYSAEDKQIISNEMKQLSASMADTIKTTEFNGKNAFEDMDVGAWKISDIGFSNETEAAGTLQNIENAMKAVTEARTKNAAIENNAEATAGALSNALEYSQKANAAITDTDMAKEYIDMTANLLKRDTAMAVIKQSTLDAKNVLSLLK